MHALGGEHPSIAMQNHQPNVIYIYTEQRNAQQATFISALHIKLDEVRKNICHVYERNLARNVALLLIVV